MIRNIQSKDKEQWKKLYTGYADFYKDAWTWANCSGGYINTDGTWFYENQLWTGTEDEITWAITKKCGTQGVHTGGTKKEVLRAVDDTVAFFKTHLK